MRVPIKGPAPAVMALWAGGVAGGQPVEQGIVSQQAHCFTPETDGRTHYFYSIAFPRAMGPRSLKRKSTDVRSR